MAEKPKQVLFVDDEPAFLDMVREVMARCAGAAWEIHTASSAGEALALLQQQVIDLVVIDVNMPVLDGIQFLGLLQRRFPKLTKVVLTGFASPERRANCLTAGAELFLEKPQAAAGWEAVFSTLKGLLEAHPEEGFRGVLRRVNLQDVIQMECLSRSTSLLEISAGDRQGRIFIEDGQIVHAEHDKRMGVEAFNALLRLTGGSFHVTAFVEPPARSISGIWEFLLMEAARLRDEHESGVAGAGTGEPAGPPAPEVLADLAKAEEGSLLSEPSLPSADESGSTAAPWRPRIEEVVICSLQGEVLYDWECPDLRGRLALLEFVSQRAKLMNVGLPLGQMDRLEASDERTRAIGQVQEDRALFVRVTHTISDGTAGISP